MPFTWNHIKLSRHFALTEFISPRDTYLCNLLNEMSNPAQVVCPSLVLALELLRAELGEPIHISSGARSKNYQDILLASGLRAAQHSPHVVTILESGIVLPSLAADIDARDEQHATAIAQAALRIMPHTCRVLTTRYRPSTFVHLDVAPVGAWRLASLGLWTPTAWLVGGLNDLEHTA